MGESTEYSFNTSIVHCYMSAISQVVHSTAVYNTTCADILFTKGINSFFLDLNNTSLCQ